MRDDVHVHVHLHHEGQGEIMGALDRIGTETDELAAAVSKIGTDTATALAAIRTAVDALRAGQIDQATADAIADRLDAAGNELAGTNDQIIAAGNDPGSPVPPVEEPPVEPPVEEPPFEG